MNTQVKGNGNRSIVQGKVRNQEKVHEVPCHVFARRYFPSNKGSYDKFDPKIWPFFITPFIAFLNVSQRAKVFQPGVDKTFFQEDRSLYI